jgi:pyruvate dehydrogenase complex dehydrogenase (E1) component
VQVVVCFFTSLIVVSVSSSAYASSSDPYDSGYDHGCNDAGIPDPSDRYINQPEKGPSFHTDAFMQGYHDGFEGCSPTNNAESIPSSSIHLLVIYLFQRS